MIIGKLNDIVNKLNVENKEVTCNFKVTYDMIIVISTLEINFDYLRIIGFAVKIATHINWEPSIDMSKDDYYIVFSLTVSVELKIILS